MSRTGTSISLLGALLASLLSPAAAEEMDASPECKYVIVTHLHEVVKQCGGDVGADAESRYLALRNILEEHLKLWPNDLQHKIGEALDADIRNSIGARLASGQSCKSEEYQKAEEAFKFMTAKPQIEKAAAALKAKIGTQEGDCF